jgi:phosphate/sulfate permease
MKEIIYAAITSAVLILVSAWVFMLAVSTMHADYPSIPAFGYKSCIAYAMIVWFTAVLARKGKS